jgi:hypothetical protein
VHAKVPFAHRARTPLPFRTPSPAARMEAGAGGGASGSGAGGAGAASAAIDAKLAAAAALKEEGNALFKEGKTGEAMVKWFELIGRLTALDKGRALSSVGGEAGGLLGAMGGAQQGSAGGLSDAQQAAVSEMFLTVHLNYAAALLKARVFMEGPSPRAAAAAR